MPASMTGKTAYKTDYYRQHDKPQKYKGNNDGSNDYRSECFRHSLISITSICPEPTRLQVPHTSSRPGCRTRCRAWAPPDVLAKNFRVAQETFKDIPLHNLWIFPGEEPGDLEADQVAAGVEWGTPSPVIFRMSQVKPVYENSGDSIRIADSSNFPTSNTVAARLQGRRRQRGRPQFRPLRGEHRRR